MWQIHKINKWTLTKQTTNYDYNYTPPRHNQIVNGLYEQVMDFLFLSYLILSTPGRFRKLLFSPRGYLILSYLSHDLIIKTADLNGHYHQYQYQLETLQVSYGIPVGYCFMGVRGTAHLGISITSSDSFSKDNRFLFLFGGTRCEEKFRPKFWKNFR